MITIFIPVDAGKTIYHTEVCNQQFIQYTEVEATEDRVFMLKTLGYTLCKTCELRHNKRENLKKNADFIEAVGIKSLVLPDDYELRVYWHRSENKNPVELWSSKGK